MSGGTTTKPVQVCEGRWRTRGNAIRNVTPTPAGDGRAAAFPWWDAAYRQTWTLNGRYHFGCEESPLDLLTYLGPLEEDKTQEPPEPEPVQVQVREGRWRTRNDMVKDVTAMPTDHEDFVVMYPWWDGVSTWRADGRWLAGGSTMDLVEYLGPIEQQPEPEPEPESEPTLPEAVIARLATAHSQLEEAADEISRLRGRLDDAERLLEQRPAQVDYRPRTYFIDIDGTLVQHAMKGQADNVTTSRLPGAKDFIDRLLAAGHRVILTTGRRKTLRLETEQQLSDAKIAYDELIMDLPPGIRIIVNDAKPDVPVTAYGITVPRNQGCLDIMRWEEHTLPGKAHAKV